MFNLFRWKKKADTPVKIEITYSTKIPAWEETKSQKLLKEATARKKAGDLDGAIESLREAFSQTGEDGGGYGLKALLRLPMYLQEAGRSDEAWGELNELILRMSSGQDKSLAMMDISIIYDKMRLFRQREKKPEGAVIFGIFSYLSWATGLHMQERLEELEDYVSREKLEATILKLLKKAKKGDLLEQICDIVEEETRSLPHSDLNQISKKVNQALN